MMLNPWISAADRPPEPDDTGPDGEKSETQQSTAEKTSYAERFLGGKSASPGKGDFAQKFIEIRQRAEKKKTVEAAKTRIAATEKAPEAPTEVPATAVAPADAGQSAEKASEQPPKPKAQLLLKALQKKREGADPYTLPAMSQSVERRLNSNSGELSLIEGHLMRMSRSISSLYCTSCFDKEGKSTGALMAAYGLATMSERNTLITETNVERPVLGKMFGIDDDPGLQDVLLEKATLEDSILPTAYDNLYVLPAGLGRLPLHDPRFEHVLDELSENFDYIIIDGKSAMTSSEASKVSAKVGGILVIVECEKTKWEVVQLLHERLGGPGASHLGVILNKRKFYLPRLVYNFLSRH